MSEGNKLETELNMHILFEIGLRSSFKVNHFSFDGRFADVHRMLTQIETLSKFASE